MNANLHHRPEDFYRHVHSKCKFLPCKYLVILRLKILFLRLIIHNLPLIQRLSSSRKNVLNGVTGYELNYVFCFNWLCRMFTDVFLWKKSFLNECAISAKMQLTQTACVLLLVFHHSLQANLKVRIGQNIFLQSFIRSLFSSAVIFQAYCTRSRTDIVWPL